MSDELKTPELTLDLVKQFLNDNEDGKKFLQADRDAYLGKGIKTFQDNFMKEKFPTMLETEITKRFPEKTEAEKRLIELETRFSQVEAEKQRAQLQSKLLKVATEKKIPDFFVDFAIDVDEATSINKLETLGKSYTETLNREIENTLKGKGRIVPLGTDKDQDVVDLKNIPDNDPEYFKKNAAAINEMLKR